MTMKVLPGYRMFPRLTAEVTGSLTGNEKDAVTYHTNWVQYTRTGKS